MSRYEDLEGVHVLSDDEGLIALLEPDDLFQSAAEEPTPDMNGEKISRATHVASIVSFRVGGALLGLHVDQVQEVLPYEKPRAVRGAPDFVRGAIDVHGRMTPVVDLRALFDFEAAAAGVETRVLLLELGELLVGLVVDDVSEVRRIAADDISPAPVYLRRAAGDHVDAVARAGDHLVLLLRPDSLLGKEQRKALAGAVRPTEAKKKTAQKTSTKKKSTKTSTKKTTATRKTAKKKSTKTSRKKSDSTRSSGGARGSGKRGSGTKKGATGKKGGEKGKGGDA